MRRDLPDFEHGTPSGANNHRLRGEKPCGPCLRANAAYMKAYRNHDKCAAGLGWPLRTLPAVRRR